MSFNKGVKGSNYKWKPNVEKSFGFMIFSHTIYVLNWVYWPIICYICPSPILQSTFEAVLCLRSFGLFYMNTFEFWLPTNFKFCPSFVLIRNKRYKCLNFCLFVCLFVCFVLYCKYDMRHESTPTSQITQQWNISMNKTEAKAFSE